jgi:hypothetical protein
MKSESREAIPGFIVCTQNLTKAGTYSKRTHALMETIHFLPAQMDFHTFLLVNV